MREKGDAVEDDGDEVVEKVRDGVIVEGDHVREAGDRACVNWELAAVVAMKMNWELVLEKKR